MATQGRASLHLRAWQGRPPSQDRAGLNLRAGQASISEPRFGGGGRVMFTETVMRPLSVENGECWGQALF